MCIKNKNEGEILEDEINKLAENMGLFYNLDKALIRERIINIPVEITNGPQIYHDWNCLYCGGNSIFTTTTIKQHVKDVHNIDMDICSLSENFIYHADAEYFYSSCSIVYLDGRPALLRKLCQERKTSLYAIPV